PQVALALFIALLLIPLGRGWMFALIVHAVVIPVSQVHVIAAAACLLLAALISAAAIAFRGARFLRKRAPIASLATTGLVVIALVRPSPAKPVVVNDKPGCVVTGYSMINGSGEVDFSFSIPNRVRLSPVCESMRRHANDGETFDYIRDYVCEDPSVK